MTTRKHVRWRPDFAVRPGETIKEAFRERGLTQLEASNRMGVSQSYVSDIVRGHRTLTPRFALRLEAITGISAEMWVGLQINYDLALERRDPPILPAGIEGSVT